MSQILTGEWIYFNLNWSVITLAVCLESLFKFSHVMVTFSIFPFDTSSVTILVVFTLFDLSWSPPHKTHCPRYLNIDSTVLSQEAWGWRPAVVTQSPICPHSMAGILSIRPHIINVIFFLSLNRKSLHSSAFYNPNMILQALGWQAKNKDPNRDLFSQVWTTSSLIGVMD